MIDVVEKVNRLIRHHGHDTSESNKNLNLKSSLKGAKAAANIKTGKMSKQLAANKRFEEDRDRKDAVNISEEEKRSFRGAKARDEMSSGVEPPQSQQASRAAGLV